MRNDDRAAGPPTDRAAGPPTDRAAGPPTDPLAVVAALLAPGAGRTVEYLAVGPPARPAFLLPRQRRVAVAACRAYNALRPPAVRRRRLAVSAAVGAGLAGAVAAPFSVEGAPAAGERPLLDELAEMLGVDMVHAAVGLGAPDEWWKPVLQLFADDGRPVGYAKVGTTPLTASLVRNEAEVLSVLTHHPVPGVVVPRLVGRGRWGGAHVVVTAPLPAEVRGLDQPLPPGCPDLGPTGTVRLVDGGWWQAAAATAVAPDPRDGLVPAGVAAAVAAATDALSGATVAVGLLHGDWVPWNLARLAGGPGSGRESALVAWDWEYGDLDAPVGLDDLHGAYQVGRQQGAGAAGALSVALLHGRATRPDPAHLDVLALAHPVHVLARLRQAARWSHGAARVRATEDAVEVAAVLARRLHLAGERAA